MSTKKNTKQNAQKTAIFKITGLRGVAILFAIIAVPVVLVILVNVIIAITQATVTAIKHNNIMTQDQAKEFLQKQANEISLPGEVVYEKIADGGCEPVGFLQGVYCTYSLKKYYKNSGSKEADIKAAEDALVRGGCVKSADYKSANGMRYGFEVPNEEKYAYCAINIFSLDNKGMYDSAKAFFGIDQDIPLQDGEYAYAINITREYKYDPRYDPAVQ